MKFPETKKLTLDDLMQIRDQMKAELPVVVEYMGGESQGLTFVMGKQPGISLANLDNGIIVFFKEHEVQINWRNQGAPYPRFTVLRELVSLIHSLNIFTFGIITLSYINLASEFEYKDVLSSKVEVGFLNDLDEVRDVNLGWQSQNIDCRLEIIKVDQGIIVATTAGTSVSGDPIYSLDNIHAELIDRFPNIISDKIKIAWELKHDN